MKLLALVRHSIAEDNDNNDFERNLTEEGLQLIAKVVQQIEHEYFNNAIFITSPANRAKQTAYKVASLIGIPENMIIEHEFLYTCFREHSFYYFLEEYASLNNNVWIFGHNPMLSNLTEQLLNKKFISLPKASAVIFQANINQWIEIDSSKVKMIKFVNSKLL